MESRIKPVHDDPSPVHWRKKTNGRTGLHLASLRGHLETVKLLVSEGAETIDGWTASDYAKIKGHEEIQTFFANLDDVKNPNKGSFQKLREL